MSMWNETWGPSNATTPSFRIFSTGSLLASLGIKLKSSFICCRSVPHLNAGGDTVCAVVHWQMHSILKWNGFFVKPYFITPPHGQPHAVSGGLVSISGECMLLCKDTVLVKEESPHITIRRVRKCSCSFGALAVVDTAEAKAVHAEPRAANLSCRWWPRGYCSQNESNRYLV